MKGGRRNRKWDVALGGQKDEREFFEGPRLYSRGERNAEKGVKKRRQTFYRLKIRVGGRKFSHCKAKYISQKKMTMVQKKV